MGEGRGGGRGERRREGEGGGGREEGEGGGGREEGEGEGGCKILLYSGDVIAGRKKVDMYIGGVRMVMQHLTAGGHIHNVTVHDIRTTVRYMENLPPLSKGLKGECSSNQCQYSLSICHSVYLGLVYQTLYIVVQYTQNSE